MGLASYALPLLLVLAFLGKQLLNLDSIGWINGFNHPLTGWDHLLTMLAVGVWAAQLRGQAVWMLPLAFVSVMSLGGLAGASGLDIPSVEGIILLSCAVFSVLITRKIRFNGKINVLIVAFFAFFHGFAHGQEISTSASLISYTLGFMLATLLLHGAGILVAKLVVLSISCFLTIGFTSAAQAKADDSMGDEDIKKFVIVHTQQASAQLDFAGFINSRYADAFSGQCVADTGGGGGFPQSGAVDPPDQQLTNQLRAGTSHAPLKADSMSQLKSLKPAAVQVLVNWPQRLFFNRAYLNCTNLDFKHYYPDINHTPGKNLLSNGVGLTSPPVRPAIISARPVFFLRSKPRFSDIAESYLQLTAAQTVGSFQSFAPDYPIQAVAVYQRLALSDIAVAFPPLSHSAVSMTLAHADMPVVSIKLCSAHHFQTKYRSAMALPCQAMTFTHNT